MSVYVLTLSLGKVFVLTEDIPTTGGGRRLSSQNRGHGLDFLDNLIYDKLNSGSRIRISESVFTDLYVF